MNKLDRWESVILLLSAVALLPIWLSRSRQLPISENVLNALQVVLVIVLVVILVRCFRRIQAALRENKNRRGPFLF